MPALESVQKEIVLLWDWIGPVWGVSPAAARVHAWLLGHPDPQESEEIAAGLEMSRGAVSMACAELAEWGVIVSQRRPGSRRLAYRAVTDLEHVIRSIIRTRKQREWDPLLTHLDRWLETLETEREPAAAEVRERLARIRGIVGAVDRLADRFLRGGALGSLGLRALIRAGRQGRARAPKKV